MCVCFRGVTEFRSSIIPDWHQLDSEVFTAAMTASASNSWDRRICDVCSLGHQMSCREKSILQLQSPLPALLRSQQSLRPWKIRRVELEETFGNWICFYKTHYSNPHLLFLLLLSLTAGWALQQSLYNGKKKGTKMTFNLRTCSAQCINR